MLKKKKKITHTQAINFYIQHSIFLFLVFFTQYKVPKVTQDIMLLNKVVVRVYKDGATSTYIMRIYSIEND